VWVNTSLILGRKSDSRRELWARVKSTAGRPVPFICVVDARPASPDLYRALQPKEAIEAWLPAHCFDFPASGRYQVRVVYHDGNDERPPPPDAIDSCAGPVRSNPVWLTVVRSERE
jgi:hypothetical protein